MELNQHYCFLEELLQAPRRESWVPTFPSNEFFSSGWNFDNSFDQTSSLATTNPSFSGLFSAQSEPSFECPFSDQTYPFVDGFTCTVPEMDTSPFPAKEYCMVEDEELGLFGSSNHHSFDQDMNGGKAEMEQASNVPAFNHGEKKNKAKRIEGQPSKNLMAERRRRKRLNDRLSMLRSIVPKISKMDRTSILGDTIDYMKDLLERINKLQEQQEEESEEVKDHEALKPNLKELKPNEVIVRNSPKFNVERREIDTRIDICCSTKPGLLLSTVNTLEALGLEIQQCVISCFNDFSLQASCSEVAEQRTLIGPEDIKQALFRTAGYGGRCL